MSRDEFPTYQKCLKNAYNLHEAMERLGITRETIELLRVKIKSSKLIPQYVIDNQVKKKKKFKQQTKLTKVFLSFSYF